MSYFRNAEDIQDNVLPTNEDVLKFFEWNRLQIKISTNTVKESLFLDAAKLVSLRVQYIYGENHLFLQFQTSESLKC